MVGDKEFHNSVSELKQVEPDTSESSPEFEPMSVGHMSKIIPSGGKRLVQTLISDVAKKMRMSSNLAKRKREEEEPAHWEDEWEGELYSTSSNQDFE